MQKNLCMSKKSSTFAPAFKKSRVLILDIKNKNCGNSSVGRARPCQGRGREFESRFPLFFFAQMYFEGVVVARSCEFESHPAHKNDIIVRLCHFFLCMSFFFRTFALAKVIKL